jgi:2-oxo-3-hexenedioate decarboxylase
VSWPVPPAEAEARLRTARAEVRTLEPLSDTWPELDEDWGYAVQAVDRATRTGAGEDLIGAKLGLTSTAKQQRMGVDRPIVGFLTGAMRLDAGDVAAALRRWAQPRIEPEIAFVTAAPLSRALRDDEVPEVVATVGVAAEVIDSRWTGYRFRLPDVVADNTSAAGVVLGDAPLPLRDAGDLAALRCTVSVDGTTVHQATGAAILGHPLRALQLLGAHLERHGEVLPAGSVVLAGALTDAVPLAAGRRYRLAVERLGAVTVTT